MGGYNFWVSKEMLYKEKKKYYQPFSLPKSAFYITGFLNPNCHEWVKVAESYSRTYGRPKKTLLVGFFSSAHHILKLSVCPFEAHHMSL